MSKATDISIVIPCYNEAENPLLEKTFNSLITNDIAISLELIIINDGSEDDSVKKIEKILIKKKNTISYKIVSTAWNTGIAMALNNGIKHARGNYVMRIDCGDIALPGRIKSQFDYLENNKHIDLIGGLTKWIDEKGIVISEYHFNNKIKSTGLDFRKEILYKNYLVHSTWMVRKELFEKIGNYNPGFVLEDYEFLVRSLARGHNVVIIPEYFTLIYMNPNGLSGIHNKHEIQQSILLMKAKYIFHLFSIKNLLGLLKSFIGYLLLTLFSPIYLRLKRDQT